MAIDDKLRVIAEHTQKGGRHSQEDALPDDVRRALDGSADSSALFAALAPSHKQEYLKWIGEAKKAETRARRVQGMLDKLNAR